MLADASFIGWNVPDIGTAVRALDGRGAWFTDPDGNTLSRTTFAAA
jgi:hypothetical protein